MAEEESKVLKKRGVESLGWITESSIMPRKHRVIEGVGASSILELKAQLYKSQEDSKRQPKEPIHLADHQYSQHLEVHRAKKKISANDGFSHKNAGVEARAAKDKLELKSVQDGSASYAALEKKAELYDKLVRGEISDEEDQEKYSVDFFRKDLEQNDQRGTTEIPPRVAPEANGDEGDDNIPIYKDVKLGRVSGSVDKNQQKQFVLEVHEEVKQAREKVSEIKLRRQEQVAAKREKLMKAYLKMQLQKKKKDASKEP